MSPTRRQLLSISVLFFWIVGGLYLGLGGLSKAQLDQSADELIPAEDVSKDPVLYGEIPFANPSELAVFQEYKKTYRLYGWIFYLPPMFGLLITAGAFGAVGSAGRLVKQMAIDRTEVSQLPVFAGPTFGFFIGLMIFGISYVVPAALITTEATLRPISLLFLCLLGGAFAGLVWERIEALFERTLDQG